MLNVSNAINYIPLKLHYDRGHIVGYVSGSNQSELEKSISMFNELTKKYLLKLKDRDQMIGYDITLEIMRLLRYDYFGADNLYYYIKYKLEDRIKQVYLSEKLSKANKQYDNLNDRFSYVCNLCCEKFNYSVNYIYERLLSYDIEKAFKLAFSKTYKSNLKSKAQVAAIKEIMLSDGYYGDMSDEQIDMLLKEKCQKFIKNYYRRRKTFSKKAEFRNVNNFNYFCTFTCDDKKCTLSEFKAKIRKALENYATRYGWKVMGAFEYGDQGISKADCEECEGRIHVHALIHIPYGKMNGKLFNISNFSKKKKSQQITINHPAFYEAFGICDFREINVTDNLIGTYVDYIAKYIMKSGEKLFYSRGIITDVTLLVDERDILGVMNQVMQKITLYDDCSIVLIDNEPCLDSPLKAA